MAKKETESTFDKNFAESEDVTNRFWDEVKGPIARARDARREKEEYWLEDLRLWACNLTEGQIYAGRSNLFIPEMHHQIENSVQKYMQGQFPNPNYFGCMATKTTSDEQAKKIQAAVYHELENKNRIKGTMEIYARGRKIFGTNAMKCAYVDRQVTIFARDPETGIAKQVTIPRYKGVLWQPCDMFRVYVTPATALDASDAEMIFEDDFVPKSDIKDLKLNGKPLYVNLDDIKGLDPIHDMHQWVDLERLVANQIYDAADMRPNTIFTTVVYKDFDLVEGGPRVPCVAVIANNNTIIRLSRNQFWMQKAPYVFGRYRKWPTKNFYAMSLPDRIRSLQYQINDIGNQTMDSMNYILNPISIIDPALAGDPGSFVLQPGAKWWGSPQGIEFRSFPDISGSGFQGMSQIRGMISQFSDNSTAIAPQLQGKARSATQASVVDREVSADLKVSIEQEQLDVLIPMCEMTHSLLCQYQTSSDQIRVQGPDVGSWRREVIRPEDLVGSVDFVWYGQQAAEKTAIRTQQLMNFYQLAVQASGTVPGMQGKIDLPKLFERVAKDAFDLNRIEDFMVDLRSAYTIDSEVENIALLDEQEVLTHMADNDDEHIDSHNGSMDQAKTTAQKLSILRHVERHNLQKAAKQKLQEQQGQIEALKMSMAQDQGAKEARGMPTPGRPDQIPSGTSEAGMTQGLRGVEAGV
jgi:hypothetical protein